MTTKTVLPLLVCLLWTLSLVAAPEFPALSGRVVDNANMLNAAEQRRIGELLAGHERAAGNQVVVATLSDLQGYDIETFSYQLGRHWGIGQRENNNGVLLVVAKRERKVRIEVGYGLEGQLTDAISANIIQAVILPAFKRGQFARGIEAGAAAIVQALGGDYAVRQTRRGNTSESPLFGIFIMVIILLSFVSSFFGGGRRGRRGYYGAPYGHRSGGFGGGGFGGGFSGGGGSFGGGGASGGW